LIISIAVFIAFLFLYQSVLFKQTGFLLVLVAQTLLIIGVFLIFAGMLAEMLIAPLQNRPWRERWVKEINVPGWRKKKSDFTSTT
jgi:hypothetical protein